MCLDFVISVNIFEFVLKRRMQSANLDDVFSIVNSNYYSD